MSYYLDLFSPDTYGAFAASDRSTSGFRERQRRVAERVRIGDKLLCYVTKLSRWCGVLEVTRTCFVDRTPIFCATEDPFFVRLGVRPAVWLEREKAIPVKEPSLWRRLSLTRDYDPSTSQWTGKFRSSLAHIEDSDGAIVEAELHRQAAGGLTYPVTEDERRRLLTPSIRIQDRVVDITVPVDHPDHGAEEARDHGRESARFQAMLARVGASMGFTIWIPKHDRAAVRSHWAPDDEQLLDVLPLNYDEATLRTIEQIDVLWLRRRSIVRAFEVEHTTAVYSGLLRMADLLALQPNMDIRLHIVGPSDRRDKVFQEIRRPVFSLLDKGPLAELCTFIPYSSLEQLAAERHLSHLADSVLDEYAESADE